MPIPFALIARIAGEAMARSTAARAASAAGKAAVPKEPRMTKTQRAADNFNKLFNDHPSHQPPPLPDRRPWWQQAGDQAGGSFRKQLDQWSANPIGQATDSMANYARQVESGKSIGQGVVDSLKKLDPTGLTGLISAGMEANLAVGTRGVNVARKVVQDDFVGMMGELLPDAAQKFLRALQDLTGAIVDRGRYLAKYNADLSIASTSADVRRIQSEMKEAQTVGKSYSRVIDEESKLENKLRDAFAPVKEAIADRLATILEVINRLVDASFIKEALAVFSEVQRVITAFMSFDTDRIATAVLEMPERIAKALFGGDDEPEDMNDVIRRALADLKKGPQGPLADPRDRQGANRFNFPIVKGL